MRIARYSVGDHIEYGTVELAADRGEHPDSVAALTGDPLATPVQYTGQRRPLGDVRLLAPVIPRSKVVGIGRNYAAHAAELGNEVPTNPMVFLKPNTSVIGPGEAIVKPAQTNDLHYEGELAVVIGRICRDVPRNRVAEVIFGYTCANDVTCRDLQQSDGQWARAKGFDTFCPIGPWIVTHLTLDEVGDLALRTVLDGRVVQDSTTALLVRDVAELVSYVSSFTTLLPGDLILTGTPAGVGPMVAGQTVEVEIAGIGTLTNPVIDAAADSEAAGGQA
jgi:2-keto-4-pentenoate hydratase/2-oxohepta-3-ene-1,7-dioic acid hydratase in catechol pathway